MKVGAALVERQATDSEIGTGLDSAWSVIRTGLRRDVGARLFDQWLKPARLGDYCPESQTLDLLVATDFSANFVSGQFGDRLRMAWIRLARLAPPSRQSLRLPGAKPSLKFSEEPCFC